MRQNLGKTLVAPAFLAASVVGACGDAAPPPTTDPTQPITSSTADATTTTPTTSSTTTATTPTSTGATGSSGASGSSDTGELPDCSMYTEQAPCEAESACYWYVEIGQCVVDCPVLTDEASCEMQGLCLWADDQCTLILV